MDLSEMKLKMAEKGFYEIPKFMWTENIIRQVNTMFKGSGYVFSNPKGSVSVFSYSGILDELTRH